MRGGRRSSARALAVCLWPLVFAAAIGECTERWVEVRTPHFLVRSDAGQATAVALAEELERFRQAVGIITATPMTTTGSDLLRVDAYGTFIGYWGSGAPRGTIGFYDAAETGPVAVVSLEERGSWGPTGIQVLRHEYAHHLLHRYSRVRYPRWYDEGFAEYLAVVEFRGDSLVLGLPALGYLKVLRRTEHWLSVRDLMESRGRYLRNRGHRLTRDRNRSRADILFHYAQGWLITHFLQHSPTFAENLPAYLLALNQPGTDTVAAFQNAFGVTYAEFGRLIRNYWYEGSLPYGVMDLANLELPVPQVRTLHPLEADAVADETRARLGEFEGRQRRRAQRALSRLLDAGIRVDEMRTLLGDLALRQGDVEAAQTHADALVATDPRSAAGATLQGRLLLRSLTAEAPDPDTLAEARAWFHRALETDPYYVPALLEVARMALLPGQIVAPESLDAVQMARTINPVSSTAAELEVELLARAGQRVEARQRAQLLLDWSEGVKQQRRVERLVEELGLELEAR